MKSICIIVLAFVLVYQANSQQSYRLGGRVMDQYKKSVVGATIHIRSLKQPPTSIIQVITDDSGYYAVPKMFREPFLLQVKMIGYRLYQSEYHFNPDGKQFTLPDIRINSDTVSLENVLVKSTVAAVVIKEDTIEYKADSFHVRQGDDVEALLSRLPGVKVNRDGSITSNGKPITKIKINGKEVVAGDFQTVTKSLSADLVDKVQVVDDYGQTAAFNGFKTGTPDKVINLQLKPEITRGSFGRGDQQIGNRQLYAGRFNVNHFSSRTQASVFLNANNLSASNFYSQLSEFGTFGQISRMSNNFYQELGGVNTLVSMVNNKDYSFTAGSRDNNSGINRVFALGGLYSYEEDKLKLYMSIQSGQTRQHRETDTRSLQLFDTSTYSSSAHNTSVSDNRSHRIYINAEYAVDSFFSIQLLQALRAGNSNFSGDGDQGLSVRNTLVNHYSQHTSGLSDNSAYDGGLLLKKRFRKAGQSLLTELGYSRSAANRSTVQRNEQDFPSLSRSNQRNDGENNASFYKIGINYTQMLATNWQINLTTDQRTSREMSSYRLFALDTASSSYIMLPSQSGTFTTRNVFYNASGFVRHKSRSITLLAGAVYQHVSATRELDKGRREVYSQYAVSPKFAVTYKAGIKTNISLNYTADLNTPNSRQLSVITDTLNPYVVIRGNPQLLAELNNQMSLTFTRVDPVGGSLFYVMITGGLTDNKILPDYSVDISGKQMITYVNANRMSFGGAYYNLSQPLFNRILEVTLGGNHYISSGFIASGKQQFPVTMLQGTHFLQFTWHPKADIEFNAGKEVVYYRYLAGQGLFKANNDSWIANMAIGSGAWDIKTQFRLTRFNDYLVSADIQQALLDVTVSRNLGRQWSVRLHADDIFNQSGRNLTRILNSNAVSDSRTTLLGRYVTAGITYRLYNSRGVQKKQVVKSDSY